LEETCSALRNRLQRASLQIDFEGTIPGAPSERLPLAILSGGAGVSPAAAPDDFRVVAIVPTYNEADIIAAVLEDLIREGLDVYVLDNWSTDGTERLAARFFGRGLLGIERIPKGGPQSQYELRRSMERIAELSDSLQADWIVVNDADEVRRSPWPGVTLRDAIFTVDRRGFNAIDYTTLIFEPTDDGFPHGGRLDYFQHFRFGSQPWHFLRINTWKPLGHTMNLADSGGHEVRFEGRRVFPYKFLLKHYPIRSQRHGERKVHLERLPRWSNEERALGWHVHYDHIRKGESFLRDSASLIHFDDRRFHEEFLIERLSGIGIEGRPSGEDQTAVPLGPPSAPSAANEVGRASAERISEAEEAPDLRSRRTEGLERERRRMERLRELEEAVAAAREEKHELRKHIDNYAAFHRAVEKSLPWRVIQFLRRLVGREW
jgi:glycosyltransferase involved in cell wall biosynthesis